MPAAKSRLLILDANALLHRAFHALPPLTSPQGEPVGALYGLSLTLLNVLKTFKPTHLVAAFDRPEKTFRHKQFAAYKAQRERAPTELAHQIGRARDLLEAFAIPVIDAKGYEADDVIGSVTAAAAEKNLECVIVTGDQDALQLVDTRTRVHLLKRGIKDTVTLGPEEVRERFGLQPEQLRDFKALRGDPSDNIPGVRGIGEKTATDLLQTFGTLERIYQSLAKIPEAARKKLEAGKRDAFLSRELVTIVRNVPLTRTIDALTFHPTDRPRVIALLREFGFASLLPRLAEPLFGQTTPDPGTPQQLAFTVSPRPKRTRGRHQLRNEADSVARLVQQLQRSQGFVVAAVPERPGERGQPLHGMALAVKLEEAFYVPASLLSPLRAVLEDRRIPKFGHNLKATVEACLRSGIELQPLAFDTMVASYVLSPGTRSHDLDVLSVTLLGREMTSLRALAGRAKARQGLADIPLERVAEVACESAELTLQLKERLATELAREPRLQSVFADIELPLIPVLARLERRGVALETAILTALGRRMGKRLSTLEKKIHTLAGLTFNVASPQQLRAVLFEKLKLPATGIARTQSGLSTAAEELEKLRDQHPIISLLQEHRELAKLKSTYVDALPKLVDPETGRVHTTYNQVATATGRLSSSDPNLQNIPVRTDLGQEVRTAFVAARGYRLLAADYSQLQLRLVAHLARDRVMQKAFREGQDIHAETAAAAFGVPVAEVSSAQRRIAKTLNFGILYGMGPPAFARAAGVSLGEAQRFIDAYFRTYRGIAEYIEEAKALAATQGYVETISGRRRYLPEINSRDPQVRSEAERMAVNHPVQGSEADILKKSMIAIDEHLQEGRLALAGVRMILTVHDELVFEVPHGREHAAGDAVKDLMEGVESLSVPLVADLTIGENWGSMRPLSSTNPLPPVKAR